MGDSGVPSAVESVLQSGRVLWQPLNSGLPDRYRILFAVAFAVVSAGGMALLGYKIRTTEPVGDREVTSKLERTDLLEGGDPNNTMELIIQVANRPVTYAILLTSLFGLIPVAVVLDSGAGVGALLFVGALVSIQTFLRFGWPYVEGLYERRQPDERDPDSLRFQGFSRDTMTFLTIVAALFVGTMGLIALETLVL